MEGEQEKKIKVLLWLGFFVTTFLGIALVVVGAIVTKSDYFNISLHHFTFVNIAYLAVAVGCLKFVSGAVGVILVCWSPDKDSSQYYWLIVITMIGLLFGILTGLDLGNAVNGSSEVYKSTELMEDSVTLSFKKYWSDSHIKENWNSYQEKYKCCGVHNWTDYQATFGNSSSVPGTCCELGRTANCSNVTSHSWVKHIYSMGCLEVMEKNFRVLLDVVISVESISVGLQVIILLVMPFILLTFYRYYNQPSLRYDHRQLH